MNWTNFTPDWTQIKGVAWVGVGCFFVRVACDGIPQPDGKWLGQLRLLLIHLIVCGAGVGFSWYLIPQSHVYAIIVGLSCSGMAVQQYGAFLKVFSEWFVPALIAKIKAILTLVLGLSSFSNQTPNTVTPDTVRKIDLTDK